MSSEPKERGVVIDVNALYAQMQAIAEEIAKLREAEGQIAVALEAVRRAKDSIDAIVRLQRGRILVPLDPQLNSFGFVEIAENDKFIVALGLGYYAEVDAAKALDTLSSKERGLLNQLSAVSKMIREYSDLYERYRATLQALLEQARAGKTPSRGG